MKKYIFLLINFLNSNINTQVNLVPNPSFENLESGYLCGTSILFNLYCENWFAPTGGTPDLFSVSCNLQTSNPSASLVSVPNNIKGYQNTHSEKSYAGAMWGGGGGGGFSEYLSIKLNEPMELGKNYCVRFYVNLAEASRYATSGIQLCFSSDTLKIPIGANPNLHTNLFNHFPQLINEWSNVILDTLNWTSLEWQYQAQGNERFITIGNFKPDSLSNLVNINSSGHPSAYYYIDDVSIIDISTPAYAGGIRATLGDSVFIGRPPEVGLNDACVWYVNDVPIDTVAGLWVSPLQTTTYVLEQNLCGIISYDSVTITVACDSYTMYNETYTTSGIYSQTLQDINGNDSTISLNLTVLRSDEVILTETACDSYTLNNETYTSSGTYVQTLTNSLGCDSTVTLNLSILQPSDSIITTSGCGSYRLNTEIYTESGIYTQVVQNAVGCDSVITLNLTINTISNETIIDNTTILSTQADANYQWINCSDFSPIFGANNQSFTAIENGSYAVVISDGECQDTSVCIDFSTIGLTDKELSNFYELKIFPNPAQNEINIVFNGAEFETEISIYSITGKEIVLNQLIKPNTVLNVDISSWKSGLYYCKLNHLGDNTVKRFTVIK